MLVGIYGIIFEFYSPGLFLPGVAGAISLLLALYAFQVLPVNYTGLALIALGLAMMVAEMLVPSFGALGIGGIIAFVVGSVMLMDTDLPGFGISWQVIGGVALERRADADADDRHADPQPAPRRGHRSGGDGRQPRPGARLGRGAGRVRVHGEIWQARGPAELAPGGTVRITAISRPHPRGRAAARGTEPRAGKPGA